MYKKLESVTELDGRRFTVLIEQQDAEFRANVEGIVDGVTLLSRSFTSSQEDALVRVTDFIDDASSEFDTLTEVPELADEDLPVALS